MFSWLLCIVCGDVAMEVGLVCYCRACFSPCGHCAARGALSAPMWLAFPDSAHAHEAAEGLEEFCAGQAHNRANNSTGCLGIFAATFLLQNLLLQIHGVSNCPVQHPETSWFSNHLVLTHLSSVDGRCKAEMWCSITNRLGAQCPGEGRERREKPQSFIPASLGLWLSPFLSNSLSEPAGNLLGTVLVLLVWSVPCTHCLETHRRESPGQEACVCLECMMWAQGSWVVLHGLGVSQVL